MNFEEQMREAQAFHLAQDYDMALCLRLNAFDSTMDKVEQGRAARDVAASFDRIGLSEPAVEWADQAWYLHDVAVVDEQNTGALRERAASSMYVGSLALRQAIHKEQTGGNALEHSNKALEMLRLGLTDIEAHEINQKGVIDQYRINMTGRVALAEGLYGSRVKAIKLGAKAMSLAALSESAVVPTFKLDMPFKDRLRAKSNAFIRGAASVVSTLLSHRPTRSIALTIANRVL